jgi:muconate cycloisomerase
MNINIQKLTLPLKEKFKISHSEFDSLEHILVIIEANEIKAYGEIVPVSFFNEPYDRALQEATNLLGSSTNVMKKIQDANDVKKFILKLRTENYLNCIICGFEMALLDYLGKTNRKMIWELLNLEEPAPRKTPLTLPIAEQHSMVSGSFKDAGLVKVKLGGNSDAQYLEWVKTHPEQKFMLDVNQGWTMEEVEKYREYLNLSNVLLVEEPVKFQEKTEIIHLRKIIQGSRLFLDESIKNLNEAALYIDQIDGVNIKVTKFGGLFHSIEAAKTLKNKNKQRMLGCFLESSLSISYAFSISSLFDFIDLDGATFIKNEPFRGAVIHNGAITRGDYGYGIGVRYE